MTAMNIGNGNSTNAQSSCPSPAKTASSGPAGLGCWFGRLQFFVVCLAILLIAPLIPIEVSAQTTRAFSPRFTNNAVRGGDIALIGNMSMHCQSGANANCAAARNGDLSIGNNQVGQMVNINVDPAAGYVNSTSATLDLPPNSQILFAGLYWGGQAINPGVETVHIKPPGQSGYITLTADQLDNNNIVGQFNRYQGFKDITTIVRTAGSGVYTVAGVQLFSSSNGVSIGGGWSMAVVYADPAVATTRSVALFDGLVTAGQNSPETDIHVSGFLTPYTGQVHSRVGIVVYDGDGNQIDDVNGNPSLEFGVDAGSLSPVFNQLNPQDNVFNSTISHLDAHIQGRDPQYNNTLGLDIDVFSPNTPLPNAATSAMFRMRGSYNDSSTLGVVSIVTDVVPPPALTKSQRDLNGGTLLPNDEIEYTIDVVNEGDNFTNVVITDPIPANTTYVANSLAITGATGQYQAAQNQILLNVGSMSLNNTVRITFRVRVNPGTTAGTLIRNVATASFRHATLGDMTNSSNEVEFEVGAAAISAAPDQGNQTAAGGVAIANVRSNDSLNGAVPTNANSTLAVISADAPLSLNATTGAVSVAPGSAVGTYVLRYQLCELLNPANCVEADATVRVSSMALVDDVGGADGLEGGTAIENVLANDEMNGAPVVRADVTLTQESTTRPSVTLDVADGSIDVGPGTPAGTYTVVYRVCEIANPINCATATATVEVTVPPMPVDAQDDSGVVDAITGGLAVSNVLDNDAGGMPIPLEEVVLTQLSTTNPAITLNTADGSVWVEPNTLPGEYVLVYRVCSRLNALNCDEANVNVSVQANMTLRLHKTTPSKQIRSGDVVRYTLVVENPASVDVTNMTVVDTPPAGFSYVDGSLQVFDLDGSGGVAGVQPLQITGIDIAAGGRATIVYLLRVGAGVRRGEHVNAAQVFMGGTAAVSNQAKATVYSGVDVDFEQALILGTVFHDANGDGVQSGDDEPGIPGVRLATVEGIVIETDSNGRFHLEGIDVGNAERGRNFIVKVDPATLPGGSSFTTRNPLVKRITQGLPARFDFGVKVPAGTIEGARRSIEMKIGEVLFTPGSADIAPEHEAIVDQMAAKVREHGGGELVITANGESEALAMDRALALRKAMESRLDAEMLKSLVVSLHTQVESQEVLVASVAPAPVLGTVLFETGSARIQPRYRPLLEKIASAVEQMRGKRIVIVGHADKRGSYEYNDALGLRRAKAVYDAVVEFLSPELRKTLRVDLSADPHAPVGKGE